MSIFFKSKGIRGKTDDDLTFDLAYKCGNALAAQYPKCRIIIARDTRKSGDLISLAFSGGVLNGGSDVVYIGVCPMAGVSYLTKSLPFDFGVIISASHNTSDFNGITIFDKDGSKLSAEKELKLEKSFFKQVTVNYKNIGNFSYEPRITIKYEKFLSSSIKESIKGKTIVLDCANGACYKIAPAVFRDNGAKIISTFCKPNGLNINEGCGSVNIGKLQKYVKKYKADMGFAFDGDGDRVLAVDQNGNVVDGDMLTYMISIYYKEINKLNPLTVVGTDHTNIAIEKALKDNGIDLLRTDIGYKYVDDKINASKLTIGGEQSGHVFIKDKLPVCDGILVALIVASICTRDKRKLSEYFNFKLYNQCNLDVVVEDKEKVINNNLIYKTISEGESKLNKGRIIVRLSGTEPCIRVMVESSNESMNKKVANNLAEVIKCIDKGENICAE